MELNTVIRALKIKMKQIKKNRRGIVKAYVSLFLVMLLALVTTYPELFTDIRNCV